MDPIKQGHEIFLEIARNWKHDQLQVPADIDAFLRLLRDRTNGWAIFDFLDAANWDCFAGHDYNLQTSSLFLYWHDYRTTDLTATADREVSKLAFPASLYGLFMHLQQIRILRQERTAAFLLQGYALTPKEAKQQLCPGSEEFILEQKNLFTARICRKVGGLFQVFDVHTAPLYTVAILPKNSGFTPSDSRHLLFDVNLVSVIGRLRTAHKRLEELDDSAVDDICEKSNTVRRALEYALKIEICYREVQPNKPYSQLLLGDLLKILHPYHDTPMRTVFSKIAEWANELSHDTGKPVDKQKASVLAQLGLLYVKLLKSSIHLNPYALRDDE